MGKLSAGDTEWVEVKASCWSREFRGYNVIVCLANRVWHVYRTNRTGSPVQQEHPRTYTSAEAGRRIADAWCRQTKSANPLTNKRGEFRSLYLGGMTDRAELAQKLDIHLITVKKWIYELRQEGAIGG
jgi:hypothetical protein